MEIAICDDDIGCCEQIQKWIEDYGILNNIKINVEVFYSAEVLLKKIKDNYYFNLILLDIELPGINGVEMAQEIRELLDEKVGILFISGKDGYSLQLFEFEPQNFLLKPLTKEKIVKEVEKTVKRNTSMNKTLRYMQDGIPKGIYLSDIMYMEASDKRVIVKSIDGSKIVIRESVQKIEVKLNEISFCRCHRSFIVNMFYVKKYYKNNVHMSDGKIIPVGRKYVENVKKIWAEYI